MQHMASIRSYQTVLGRNVPCHYIVFYWFSFHSLILNTRHLQAKKILNIFNRKKATELFSLHVLIKDL